MAKKKAAVIPAAKAKGRPKLANQKPPTPIAMTIRAGDDWQEWMDLACDRLKKETGMGKIERTQAVDFALGLLAEKLDIPAPPDRY